MTLTFQQRTLVRNAIDKARRERANVGDGATDHLEQYKLGISGYRYGCRCAECRAAIVDYQAAWRRRNPVGRVNTHNANGYKNGCHCDVCSAAMLTLLRARRAKVAA